MGRFAIEPLRRPRVHSVMLVELRIRDFAVIEELSAEFGAGLTALTGETGAGKSIVVGALSLLLGHRASSASVRAGASRARVEAVFDVRALPDVAAKAEELGVDDPDGMLILRREVVREGRSRAWVNGSPTTASMLAELGGLLIDLHGQHEHQSLHSREAQRRLLDAYAGAQGVAAELADAHRARHALHQQRQERQERIREIEGRRDFLQFQLGELEAADAQPGEDDALRTELGRLEHADDLVRGAHRLAEQLYLGEGALTDQIRSTRDEVRRLVELDTDLDAQAAALESLYHQLVDVGRALGDYAERTEHDPERVEEVRTRLDLLYRLKRKYGPELEDVLRTRHDVAAELSELDGSALAMGELERQIAEADVRFERAAADLSARRQEAGARLSTEVAAILPLLGLKGARFEVHLAPLDQPGAAGAETVSFLVSMNEGFAAQPLAKVASGGELARVMLALKTVLAKVDQVPTLVFDEVDAGIGGSVANAVGRTLRDVSRRHQVFVVTHLPQVASRASAHLRVVKDSKASLAQATLEPLRGEDRVAEIARMLGGDPDSQVSQEHARELLAG